MLILVSIFLLLLHFQSDDLAITEMQQRWTRTRTTVTDLKIEYEYGKINNLPLEPWQDSQLLACLGAML